jgi:hypothetical protein
MNGFIDQRIVSLQQLFRFLGHNAEWICVQYLRLIANSVRRARSRLSVLTICAI